MGDSWMLLELAVALLHPQRHATAILLGLLHGLLRRHGASRAAHQRLLSLLLGLERGLEGLLGLLHRLLSKLLGAESASVLGLLGRLLIHLGLLGSSGGGHAH